MAHQVGAAASPPRSRRAFRDARTTIGRMGMQDLFSRRWRNRTTRPLDRAGRGAQACHIQADNEKAKPHEGKRILYNLNRFREDLGRLSKGEGEVRRPTAAFSIMS